MPRIRIVQPGWTTYTGDLHTVAFTNGLSDLNISELKAQQLAASFKVEDNAAPGVPYGAVNGLVPLVRLAVEPDRNSPASGIVDVYAGSPAYGSIFFTEAPAIGDAVTVNGVTFTAAETVSDAEAEFEIGINGALSAINLANALAGSSNPALAGATYAQWSNDYGDEVRIILTDLDNDGSSFTLASDDFDLSGPKLGGHSRLTHIIRSDIAKTWRLHAIGSDANRYKIADGVEGDIVSLVMMPNDDSGYAEVHGTIMGDEPSYLQCYADGSYTSLIFVNGAWRLLSEAVGSLSSL